MHMFVASVASIYYNVFLVNTKSTNFFGNYDVYFTLTLSLSVRGRASTGDIFPQHGTNTYHSRIIIDQNDTIPILTPFHEKSL